RAGCGARRADLLLVLPVSIAWPVDDDDVAAVNQPVDEGGRAEVVAEVVAPAFPRDVAGDDRRAVVVVPGKQHLLDEAGASRLVALAFLEAYLVYDQELRTGIRLERVPEGVVGEAHVETREHVGAGGVEHATIGGAREQGERERDVTLAGAGH